jgi:hypothetical protein
LLRDGAEHRIGAEDQAMQLAEADPATAFVTLEAEI